METLSNDPLFLLALEMDLPDMLRWCATNKKHLNICQKDNLWLRRIDKDFGPELNSYSPQTREEFLNQINLHTTNNREKYILLYQLNKLKQYPLFKNGNIYSILMTSDLSLKNSIPKGLDALKNLRRFIISGKNIKQIPEEIFDLNLIDLDINYTNITTISPKIGKLSKLRRLDLSNNKLSEIPNEIGNLTELRYLSLFNNNLTSLPDSLKNLTNLQILSISDNKIKNLPDFSNLKNLQSFRASNNKINVIPSYFTQLPYLREILMVKNPLYSWPQELEMNDILIR
jgi:Leucine-rich repeat (LRR) protein